MRFTVPLLYHSYTVSYLLMIDSRTYRLSGGPSVLCVELLGLVLCVELLGLGRNKVSFLIR